MTRLFPDSHRDARSAAAGRDPEPAPRPAAQVRGPDAPPTSRENIQRLAELVRDRRLVVLTGAGASTESGIPDYRGAGGRLREGEALRRRPRTPMHGPEFEASPQARARYWARSMAGWGRFSGARPNPAHVALASLEEMGIARGVITQNVDGLHQEAGSREVLELHGSLARVRCLACREIEARAALQLRLEALNPGIVRLDGVLAPDGDVELSGDVAHGFRVAGCRECGGVLKPDVVFFGDTVPRERVDTANAWCDAAEALLVVGTSLEVFSGRRFVDRARRAGTPIAIVNVGPTRSDAHASLKIEGLVGEVLPRLAERLAASGDARGPASAVDQFAAKQ